MKNKGFTLIELLAVIVILAIIALIAVPILLNVIENSRDEANERSIELYADAVKNGLATYQLHNDDEVPVGTYSSETLPFTVNYNGDVECGSIKIRENKKLTLSNCKVNGEEVNYIYGSSTLGDHIISSNGGYSNIIDLSGEYELIYGGAIYEPSSEYNKNFHPVIDQKNGLITNLEKPKRWISLKNETWDEYSPGDIYYVGKKYNAEAGTGLYKTEDNLGTSYYFRGDVKNNYVKLSGKEIVHHEAIKEEAYEPVEILTLDIPGICGEDQECVDYFEIMVEVYPKMKFASKELCEEFGGYEGLWTTCQASNIKDIYYIEEDESIFFTTEKDCVDSYNAFDANINSCLKHTLKDDAAYDEVVYNDAYYRIVRINGDGTIRLIYDGEELVENGVTHTATTTSSLDTWYQKNIVNNSFDKYIASSSVCNEDVRFERFPGILTTDYPIDSLAYYKNTNKTPDLLCQSSYVNNFKVGFLTYDEAAMAGAIGKTSKSNYLAGSSFITSTFSSGYINHQAICYEECCESYGASDPTTYCYVCGQHYCYQEYENYFVVAKDGSIISAATGAIRPVINLIADVPFTGEGTIDNPYVIKSY